MTQKVTLPIVITSEQRFLLPTEKALKQAHGLVQLRLKEPANQCDMSVQLETKPTYLKNNYTAKELESLFLQYTQFFDDMGGMLSFLMPDVVGIKLHFNDEVNDNFPAQFEQKGNQVVIPKAWFKQGGPLKLKRPPIRITAMTD